MERKQTQRVTLDELAAMIQRNFQDVATKAQVERLETNTAAILVRIEEKIDGLPDRLIDKLTDRANILYRLDRVEKELGIRHK